MRGRLAVLGAALGVAAAVYLGWGLRGPYGFILSLRAVRLGALVLVGASVGAATVVFQTVTANRLLTPGIVGFDALFVLIQTALVLVLGAAGHAALPALPKFAIEAACLCLIAAALFGAILRRGAADMTRLVLTGVILGVLMRGLAGFMQRMLDPSAFAVLQIASVASFNAVDPAQLAMAAPLAIAAFGAALHLAPRLDIAALGRDRARALGMDHDGLTLAALAVVAALVAASTALVGPVTFLGLLAAGLAGAAVPDARHRISIPAAAVMGAVILVVGQILFERVLGLQSTLAVLVEFAGGLAFLFLVLKRRPG